MCSFIAVEAKLPNQVKRNKTEKQYSSFTEGFENGYIDGYCNGNYGCIKPIIPIAPIPKPGYNTYKGGYLVGFKQGMRDSPY